MATCGWVKRGATGGSREQGTQQFESIGTDVSIRHGIMGRRPLNQPPKSNLRQKKRGTPPALAGSARRRNRSRSDTTQAAVLYVPKERLPDGDRDDQTACQRREKILPRKKTPRVGFGKTLQAPQPHILTRQRFPTVPGWTRGGGSILTIERPSRALSAFAARTCKDCSPGDKYARCSKCRTIFVALYRCWSQGGGAGLVREALSSPPTRNIALHVQGSIPLDRLRVQNSRSHTSSS